MNIEQAKRLEKAGFPFKTCELVMDCKPDTLCPENTNSDCKQFPSEREIMAYLISKNYTLIINNMGFSLIADDNKSQLFMNPDLTENLIQAIEAVAGRGGSNRQDFLDIVDDIETDNGMKSKEPK